MLSFPGPLAVRLGYDAKLLAALAERLARAVMQDMRRSVKQRHVLASVASLHAGVVTVVQGGAADPSQYRQFKLRGGHNGNDLSALEEILTRRLGHREWPLPEIVVVDGGELQYGVAEQVLRASQLTIPLVGVVKNAKHQPERLIGPEALTVRFKREILLANNEAHRFAIVFHRKRRSKEFLS